MQYLSIKKDDWDKTLDQLLLSFSVFAAVRNEFSLDYEFLRQDNIKDIVYNVPKPSTSLKTFFLPVRENVTAGEFLKKKRLILGAPSCDVAGLKILDEIYLDKDFNDIYYRNKRENTIIISSDCLETKEHCHCTAYGVRPWSEDGADLAVLIIGDVVLVRVISEKGSDFKNSFLTDLSPAAADLVSEAEYAHKKTETMLMDALKDLPDYERTGELVSEAKPEIWKKYAARCVSCGACTTICPTCSCFLLIDRPEFEKVKQMDACQYPGFERVAGGEDSLFRLPDRFRNRYMCKYVWKPQKFNSAACTGCGRCTEACIGKINKNEMFLELSK
jgi:ferredoxin